MPEAMDETPFLSHVFIASGDLAATRRVMEILGLDLLMGDPDHDNDDQYVRYGGEIGFHAGLESTSSIGGQPYIELNIRVPDVDAAQRALTEAGFDIPEPVVEEWGAKHASFTVGGIRLGIASD
jgi:hypothetical protein